MPLRQTRGGQHTLDCGEGEGNCCHDEDNDNDDAQTNVDIVPNGSGGGEDGNCALSLTQEAEDRRAEPRVAPREFERLRRWGGPLAALRRQREDPAKTTATSKRWL